MSVAPKWFVEMLDAIADYVRLHNSEHEMGEEDAADRAWLLFYMNDDEGEGE